MIGPTAAALLFPSLIEGRFRCATHDGRVAVIVLDAPEDVADDELVMAARLHAALGRGLLVVF